MNTLTILKNLVTSTFPTNGTKQISAANVRTFLNTILDSLFTPAATTRIWPGPVSTIQAGWHLMDGSEYSQTEYADLFANLGGPSSPYGVGTTTFQIPLVKGGQTIIQCGISSFYIYPGDEGSGYSLNDILTAPAPIGGVSAKFKITNIDTMTLKVIENGNGYVNTQRLSLLGGTGSGLSIIITSTYNLAATGGEEKHVQTESEMFRHTHVQDAHQHNIPGITGGDNSDNNNNTRFAGGDKPTGQGTLFSISTSAVTATNQYTGSGAAFNVMNPHVAMNYIIKLY